jgi:hypothetical protein
MDRVEQTLLSAAFDFDFDSLSIATPLLPDNDREGHDFSRAVKSENALRFSA